MAGAGLDGVGSVLGVWGHPDDETYLSAGLMRTAVLEGRAVRCVTATRGELGSPDPERWPPGAPLAAVRTAELEAALAALGVSDHHWLDYPDGGCADVPLDEGAARVLEHLDAVRPDTVLTFGPDGMTGHPDHQAVSRWVDAAVERWSGPRPRVLWATHSTEWNEVWAERLRSAGAYMVEGFQPTSVPAAELPVYVALEGAGLEAKLAALRSMPSQIAPLIEHFGIAEYTRGMSEEGFRWP